MKHLFPSDRLMFRLCFGVLQPNEEIKAKVGTDIAHCLSMSLLVWFSVIRFWAYVLVRAAKIEFNIIISLYN